MAWLYHDEVGKGPGAWKKRAWAILAALLVVIIVVIVVPVVITTEQKNRYNRYPNYTRLNYKLSDTYSGTTFFDKFDYFTGYDPTFGHVHYVPREHAAQLNLTSATSTSAVLRVDTSVGPGNEPDASTGRFSVRVESKAQYDRGLFVFDIRHTPFGCGTWPALWLTDRWHWPANGEIDVMEATNQASSAGNTMSLHTTSGCGMWSRREMTGSAGQLDCYNNTNYNSGCNVAGAPATYGPAFNARGGGVMALELRGEGIRMWQFPRGSLPADISAGSATPDPSSWGTALADFPSTDCDIGSHFRNQSIIVNIDLCGTLTESVYGASGCPSNCVDYVSRNPSAFTDAFWEFGSFRVYQPAS